MSKHDKLVESVKLKQKFVKKDKISSVAISLLTFNTMKFLKISRILIKNVMCITEVAQIVKNGVVVLFKLQ